MISGVQEALESELKLGVPALFTLPPLIGPDPDAAEAGIDLGADSTEPVGAGPVGLLASAVNGGRLSLRAAYHDTADLRLARDGVTLRHRTGEGRPTWTLKLPADSAREGERSELSVPGAAGHLPDELRRLVTAHARTAPLLEVVRLTTRRDVWSLRDPDGQEVAELVDDLVSVVSDRKVVARFRELEIERRGIAPTSLTALVDRLAAAGAVRGAFQPKLMRALGPRATAVPDVPPAVRIRRSDPAAALVTEAIRSGVRRLLAQDVRVRLGRDDGVHQMRVACRRLRSDLGTFAPLLAPGAYDQLREELAWLAGALGAARDLEVLRERLATTMQADPLAPLDPAVFARLDALLGARERAALEAVGSALDDERYVRLLEDAVAAAREPATAPAASGPAKQVLPALVAVSVAELDDKVDRMRPLGPDHRWHTARIRAKRARYAAEAAATALGSPAAALATALADVQGLLGDHQDSAVAAGEVLAVAASHPDDTELVLLCGRLAERERAGVRGCRGAFPAVWRTASTGKVRRWLPELP